MGLFGDIFQSLLRDPIDIIRECTYTEPMSFTLRELTRRLLSPARLYIWVGVSVICGVSGPYHTIEVFGAIGSFGFWGIAVSVGIVLAVSIDLTLPAAGPMRLRMLRSVVMGFIFGLVYSVFLKVVVVGFYPADAAAKAPFWFLFLNAFTISTAILVLREQFHLRPGEITRDFEPQARFLGRLSGNLGKNIMRVSSQDHYVEVQTDKGKDLILMRFADALDELDGLDGIRVHRSHWVSRRAIENVERSAGKIVLNLCDGSTIPVSRSYRAEARSAGLI